METYFHDHNPWSHKLTYIDWSDVVTLMGEVAADRVRKQYGEKIDAYLLPQPGGRFSLGLRYGASPAEYLSPQIDDETALQIWISKRATEPLGVDNQITAFFHCAQCMREKPDGTSPREWVRLEAGWTPKGLQVWCMRHDLNIINIDLLGHKVYAETRAKGGGNDPHH